VRPTQPELVQARAHEIRNPIASIAGCAATLLESGSRLDGETREALLRVIVEQAHRLDWLTRAAQESEISGDRTRAAVDAEALVREAASFAGYASVVAGPSQTSGDERRWRMALEALMLALRPSEHDAVAIVHQTTNVITIRAQASNVLGDAERLWKLALAQRIFEEQGAVLEVHQDAELIEASVSLPQRVHA